MYILFLTGSEEWHRPLLLNSALYPCQDLEVPTEGGQVLTWGSMAHSGTWGPRIQAWHVARGTAVRPGKMHGTCSTWCSLKLGFHSILLCSQAVATIWSDTLIWLKWPLGEEARCSSKISAFPFLFPVPFPQSWAIGGWPWAEWWKLWALPFNPPSDGPMPRHFTQTFPQPLHSSNPLVLARCAFHPGLTPL
jgi:hypothetical protein